MDPAGPSPPSLALARERHLNDEAVQGERAVAEEPAGLERRDLRAALRVPRGGPLVENVDVLQSRGRLEREAELAEARQELGLVQQERGRLCAEKDKLVEQKVSLKEQLNQQLTQGNATSHESTGNNDCVSHCRS